MKKLFEVVFEDEDILVVVKPAGILSQGDGTNSPDMVSLIKGYLSIQARRKKKKAFVPYVAVIHRLDRGVRGLMVYAKTKQSASKLSMALKEKDFEKIYLALLKRKEGDGLGLSENFIRLRSFFQYDKRNNLSLLVDEGQGDEAILEYRIKKLTEKEALSEIRLITGRRHQIRLQMSEISHGIYGDHKYNTKREEDEAEIALECLGLSFPHPITGERLSFRIKASGDAFSKFD